MRQFIVFGFVWLAGAPVWAQGPAAPLTPKAAFEQADKEAAWRDDFDGVELKEWQTGGTVLVKDGHLVLGGPGTSLLQTKSPLGQRFKILIECRNDGPQTLTIILQTREFLGRGASAGSLNIKTGEWTELLLVGETNEQGAVGLTVYRRNLTDKTPQTDGTYGGRGTPTFSLEVPPGGSMTIKKIRVQTTAPRDTSAGLYIALGVVLGVMLLIVLVGWFLRRRAVSRVR